MELLLILSYTAICVAIFKIFRLPLNKWTVPTAILGGVVMISAIMFTMNYNHPYSESAREYFVTTPITPDIAGTVTEKHVVPNQWLNKGDPLFTLDPVPYQLKVDSLAARTKSAGLEYERVKTLYASRAVSRRDFDVAESAFDDLSAQLRSAKLDLADTVVRAPTAGFVTQDFLRPGMRVVSAPLRPVMVFVHREEVYYTAFFRQNSLLRLEPGFEAEVALDGIPGEVFEAEVVTVIPAMREGQLQPSGELIGFNGTLPPGRVAVVLRVTDPDYAPYAEKMPLGSYGQAAVYSDHAHHVALIRKILLRMSAWTNYLYPFH
jgi:multidrug resistance efflux pump